MKKRFTNPLLFLLLAIFLLTCNKKKEGECIYSDNQSQLLITVINNNGDAVDEARVTIFDSYENYLKATSSKNNPQYSLDSIYSDSSAEVKLMIDPYKDHWILASIYDSIQNKYLSSELTISKMDKLQSCSDYHIKLQLEPVGGVVAFWTSSGINLPIKVQFNGVSHDLTDSTLTAPTSVISPAPPKQLIFPSKAGTYVYQATSSQGCSWQGEVTIKDGEYKVVKLEPCKRALVAFYFNSLSAIPADKQTIQVFIDNNPTALGTLTAPYSGTPFSTSCPPHTNVLYLFLEPGVSHTYKCVSAPGGTGVPCIWTGSTTVLTDDCNSNLPVYLEQGCN